MKHLLVVLLAILLTACASAQSRALTIARTTPHFEAGYEVPTTDTMKGPMARLWTLLESNGVTIEYIEMGPFGTADLQQRHIDLQDGLPLDAAFEVLAHEAGHLLQSPALMDRSVAEVFAELVGIGVQRYYGRENAAAAGRYLALHKHALGALPFMQRDIEYAVRALTGQQAWPKRDE